MVAAFMNPDRAVQYLEEGLPASAMETAAMDEDADEDAGPTPTTWAELATNAAFRREIGAIRDQAGLQTVRERPRPHPHAPTRPSFRRHPRRHSSAGRPHSALLRHRHVHPPHSFCAFRSPPSSLAIPSLTAVSSHSRAPRSTCKGWRPATLPSSSSSRATRTSLRRSSTPRSRQLRPHLPLLHRCRLAWRRLVRAAVAAAAAAAAACPQGWHRCCKTRGCCSS